MSRALLVIDVQNEYFTGALPITHPVGHLETILGVMDAARETGLPVITVQHHFADNDDMPIFRRGTNEWELHSEIARRPVEHHIEKQLPGSFTGTDLKQWLTKRSIDTVTIAGYMTHMCCDTTARQAVHLGLNVEFLSDATGTLPLSNTAGEVTAEELHRSILCAQQMLLSEVISASDWTERITNEHA